MPTYEPQTTATAEAEPRQSWPRSASSPGSPPGASFDDEQAPITVCHPVWRLGCGGLERQLLQTVRWLPRTVFRHVVMIRGCDEGAPAPDGLAGENVHVVQDAGPTKDRRWTKRLAAILRDHAVDVLHVRGLAMLPDCVVAARLCGDVAVGFSFHGFEAARPRLGILRRRICRAAALRCHDRWAVSRAAAEAIARALHMPAADFGVLPNGVDTRRYAPTSCQQAARHDLGLPSDRIVVLSVGNLKPVKGQDVLLAAATHLGAVGEQITLVLVGADCLNGRLHRWTARHLPNVDVRFVGPRDDPLPFYHAADVFVLPSRWEGMSNALLEAMSCGLPVVATAAGGNVDVVEDGRTGLLVDVNQPKALAKAIRRLVEDQPLRTTLGQAGRQQMQERHTAAMATARYVRRYKALAGQAQSVRTGVTRE